MADAFPFLFFGHGEIDPEYMDKCEEVFVWFARPLTKSERARVVAACPPPLAEDWTWGDRFAYFGSAGDTYDWAAAMAYGDPAFRAAVEAGDERAFGDLWAQLSLAAPQLQEAFEAWAKTCHAEVAPIVFLSGPNADDEGDAWAAWSEANASRAVAAIRAFAREAPWAAAREHAGAEAVEPAPEARRPRGTPRVEKYKVMAAARGRVGKIFGWIFDRVMSLAASAPGGDRDALTAVYESDGLEAPFERLTYADHHVQSHAALVTTWLDAAADPFAALTSLPAYIQLAYLASYPAEEARWIERFEDPASAVAALRAALAPRRRRVGVTLVAMVADGELHMAPGYRGEAPRGDTAERAARAVAIYETALADPESTAQHFVHAARFALRAGDPARAL